PRWLPEPPATPSMPTQEPGQRPRRPLPYRVSVTATPRPGRSAVELTLRNSGTATANLLVFPCHGPDASGPGHDVSGSVTVDVPGSRDADGDGRYDIVVTGPAGFHFTARGTLDATPTGGSGGTGSSASGS
ncbi:MAG: DUF756 domain-containing protein, partial [Corynebacterium sp.]|nr:DUF756 domain-containing protein [Corynebacterium sp.]